MLISRSAAVHSLAAVASVMAYYVTYAWMSRRSAWPLALCVSYLAWLLSALIIRSLPIEPVSASILAVGSLLVAPHLMPSSGIDTVRSDRPGRNTAIRMLTGAILTVIVSSLASVVGTRTAGLLALYHIMSSVLAVFTHRDCGSHSVIEMLRGLVRGMYSLAAFCLTVCLLPSNLAGVVFPTACFIGLVVQALSLVLQYRPQTRAKRIETIVAMLARGETFH